jgi:TetR/AcrR family tetracycline transcriptional repressor
LGLSAEGIYRAALGLVDSEGLEALTMRRLAAELGVAPMSLYGHVPTKERVLMGVVNLVVSEFQLPDPATEPWEAFRSVLREFRRVALCHPNLVPITVRQPPTGAEGLLTLEASLDALRRAGLPPAETARAYRLSAAWAIGFVSLECGGFFKPVDIAAGDQVAPIDLSMLPRLAEVGPYLDAWEGEVEFERGLDVLVGVIASWARSPDTGQAVQDNGRRGGDVEGVDAGADDDANPAVGDP